jgi:hypothetical protein
MPNWLIDENGTVPSWVGRVRCLQAHDAARLHQRKCFEKAAEMEANPAAEQRWIDSFLDAAIRSEREAQIFLKAAIEPSRD